MSPHSGIAGQHSETSLIDIWVKSRCKASSKTRQFLRCRILKAAVSATVVMRDIVCVAEASDLNGQNDDNRDAQKELNHGGKFTGKD